MHLPEIYIRAKGEMTVSQSLSESYNLPNLAHNVDSGTRETEILPVRCTNVTKAPSTELGSVLTHCLYKQSCARPSHTKAVERVDDFSTRKPGDSANFGIQIAGSLVRGGPVVSPNVEFQIMNA
jgi:hypothetical protein